MKTVLMVIAGLVVGAAPAVWAQGPNPGLAADAYATHAKQNAELMQKYTWKMRVQLTYKGEDKPAQLYQMNYVKDSCRRPSSAPHRPRPGGSTASSTGSRRRRSTSSRPGRPSSPTW